MGRLDGKVAVVTGGANGIGRACALRFAEEDADVVIGDVIDDAGATTVKELEAAGAGACYLHTDVTIAGDNEALMQRALDDFGGLDVVVTAAGISHSSYRSDGDVQAELARLAAEHDLTAAPAEQLVTLTHAEWQRVLDVNLTGTLFAIQAAGRRMLAHGRGGSIVTIASIAAKVPETGPVAYTVSKAGVWMLTKQAARAFGPVGIRVNAIGPGYIETNLTAILREIPGVEEQLLAQVPLGRMGRPREIADAALFLASDESSYFTGEILHPDGGFYTD